MQENVLNNHKENGLKGNNLKELQEKQEAFFYGIGRVQIQGFLMWGWMEQPLNNIQSITTEWQRFIYN